MRWTTIAAALALLAGCAAPVVHTVMETPPLPPEPFVAPAVALQQPEPRSLWSRLFSDALAAALPQDTNSYFQVPFTWDYSDPVDAFRFYYGPSPGTYFTMVEVVTNFYTLSKTNWAEEYVRHYYAVTAIRMGRQSDFSRELPYPSLPHTRYQLTWMQPEPLVIIGRVDARGPREQWPVIARTSNGETQFNAVMPQNTMVFSAYRTNGAPEVLTVETYNPLN